METNVQSKKTGTICRRQFLFCCLLIKYSSGIALIREPMARLVAFPTSTSVLLHPPLPFQFQWFSFHACQLFNALKRKFHEATDLPLNNLACETESSHPWKTVPVYFEILTGVYSGCCSAIFIQFDIFRDLYNYTLQLGLSHLWEKQCFSNESS